MGGCLGGDGPCFRRLCGVSERGRGELSSGLSQPGGNSCWAVWWSGLWCSITVFLMVGAGRWVGSFIDTIYFAGASCKGKCAGWRGKRHGWSLQLCSLSAGGSCGLLHYRSRTRQWRSWSARFIGSPVESGEDGWRTTCSFQSAERV